MRSTVPIRSRFFLLLGGASLLLSTSCTTTSNLSGVTASNINAVNRIADEDVQEVASPGDVSDPTPAESIVGAPAVEQPAQLEQVAQKRDYEPKPVVSLTTVPRTSVGNRPTNQIMMVRTTAYSHLQADSLQYGRLSAAGNTLQYGNQVRSAAADWSKYPLGTRFVIEGLPYQYVVDDYGSALCGTETIDIYKPNLSGIGDWGVRNVPIRVLEWGSFEESAKILNERKHVKHANHVRKMLNDIERKGLAGYKKSGGSA